MTKKIRYSQTAGGQISYVDQKYEKVASIDMLSAEYNSDEKKIRSFIKDNNALIQYEKKNTVYPKYIIELLI